MREALVQSISGNISIRFFWDLHGGADEDTAVANLATGELQVTFLSPKWKVRVVAPDNIVVDV